MGIAKYTSEYLTLLFVCLSTNIFYWLMIPPSPHWASEINNLYLIVPIINGEGGKVVQNKSINHDVFILYYILHLSSFNIVINKYFVSF